MSLSAIAPVVVCGGGMALCMYLMSRGHKGHDAAPSDEVEALRREVAELRAERKAGADG